MFFRAHRPTAKERLPRRRVSPWMQILPTLVTAVKAPLALRTTKWVGQASVHGIAPKDRDRTCEDKQHFSIFSRKLSIRGRRGKVDAGARLMVGIILASPLPLTLYKAVFCKLL
jgi:hypothetical protein